jgi:heme o synthase
MSEKLSTLSIYNLIGLRLKAYVELLKLRLSLLVVFSGGIGFLIAAKGTFSIGTFILFCLGALFTTGGANIINQVLETESDKLMDRTKSRPLPSARINQYEALLLSIVLNVTGFLLLYFFVNPLSGYLAILSVLLYGFAYTPLKKITPIAVFVGAFPGAMPPLIGYAAGFGTLGLEAGILFMIQFVWQFPHFWAIAWVLDEDYRKAGIRLLPSGGERNKTSALQILIYTLCLIPVGLLPLKFGMSGYYSAVIILVSGVLFLFPAILLLKNESKYSAKLIMFGSFLYLPIVQISLLADRLI